MEIRLKGFLDETNSPSFDPKLVSDHHTPFGPAHPAGFGPFLVDHDAGGLLDGSFLQHTLVSTKNNLQPSRGPSSGPSSPLSVGSREGGIPLLSGGFDSPELVITDRNSDEGGREPEQVNLVDIPLVDHCAIRGRGTVVVGVVVCIGVGDKFPDNLLQLV
ncbi:UNVERIFIED_CONTAM: hypothetical protein Sradi_3875300 [Sesamum radiatum]|uniref:Uncharacterized protein n=1 Tax=Sesamum radiatum TaxID=300843 RepID=A0AAW2Q2F2_SESRA